MATAVGDLVVKLSGDASGLNNALGSASKNVAQFKGNAESSLGRNLGGGLDSLAGRLQSFAGVASAAAIPATFAQQFLSTAAAADDLSDSAERLGMSVRGLQQFKAAAEMSGVSFDTFTAGMAKAEKLIGEAFSGNAQAEKSLRAIGLASQEMIADSPEEAFRKIAVALADVENPMERTRLEMDIFGKSGQQLRQVLNDAAQGMAKYNSMVASDVAVANLSKVADRWDGIKKALSAAKTEMMGDLATKFNSWFGMEVTQEEINKKLAEEVQMRREAAEAMQAEAAEAKRLEDLERRRAEVARIRQEQMVDSERRRTEGEGILGDLRDRIAEARGEGADPMGRRIEDWKNQAMFMARDDAEKERIQAQYERMKASYGRLEREQNWQRAQENERNAQTDATQLAERFDPNKRFEREKRELDRLKHMAPETMTEDIYARALKDLEDRRDADLKRLSGVKEPGKDTSPTFTGAAERGSAEAWSTILANMAYSQHNPTVQAIDKLTDVAEQQYNELVRQTDALIAAENATAEEAL